MLWTVVIFLAEKLKGGKGMFSGNEQVALLLTLGIPAIQMNSDFAAQLLTQGTPDLVV
jgi:hypothetical protein